MKKHRYLLTKFLVSRKKGKILLKTLLCDWQMGILS